MAPLYRLPLFSRRQAFGGDGYPFTLTNRVYEPGLCPVAERLHEEEAVLFEPCAYDADDATAGRLAEAVRKVHQHRADLAGIEDGD